MEKKKYQLPKEFATKWVEALRSGEYKQGIATLCNKDQYCCLGVLGKINGFDDEDMSEISDISDFSYIYAKKYNFNQGVLSISQQQKLQNILMNMNDVDGKNFTEIADWIEENVIFV